MTPKWFCWRGHYRAEFVTLDAALNWRREHGGIVTDSPTGQAQDGKRLVTWYRSVRPSDGGETNYTCAAWAEQDRERGYTVEEYLVSSDPETHVRALSRHAPTAGQIELSDVYGSSSGEP